MKIDIAHVAKLANLTLTPAEEKTFEKQLGEIVNYVSQLDELNTEKVEPIAQITGLKNVNRTDEPAPSLTQEEALKNAPKIHNGFFEVEGILDTE